MASSVSSSPLHPINPLRLNPVVLSSYQEAAASVAAEMPPSSPLTAGPPLPDLPPIEALFLVDFDVKAGYTISWRRQASTGPSAPRLDGAVEYKSLPSGLHTVQEDLVYFVQDRHAGLSAFVNARCDDNDDEDDEDDRGGDHGGSDGDARRARRARRARMMAVGILVPLSHGRLGRAWKHAEALKDMTANLVRDRKLGTDMLERYWDQSRALAERPSPPPTPAAQPQLLPPPPKQGQVPGRGRGHRRARSASDGTLLLLPPSRGGGGGDWLLSAHHPAWSLVRLLDTFGPLIFPIHRAAILRQRILISCQAPVHEACNFVYDFSILSNIPLSVRGAISPRLPACRLRPLFAIGVHDIPFLLDDHEAAKRREEAAASGLYFGPDNDADDADEDDSGTGWIACTTDSILAVKDGLWDMLISLPRSRDHPAAEARHPERAQKRRRKRERAWPAVEWPRGTPIRATQRDMRRFRMLHANLGRFFTPAGPDSRPDSGGKAEFDESQFDPIVEPLGWAALTYRGFMWWASAGEEMAGTEQEEAARDAALFPGPSLSLPSPPISSITTPLASNLTPPGLTPTLTPNLTHPWPVSPSATTHPSPSRRATDPGLAAPVDLRPDDEAGREMAIITYFHRLTAQMLTVLSNTVRDADSGRQRRKYTRTEAVEGARGEGIREAEEAEGGVDGRELDDEDDAGETDRLLMRRLGEQEQDDDGDAGREEEDYYDEEEEDEEEDEGRRPVRVGARVLREMGLDGCNPADVGFVAAMLEQYFGRQMRVEGRGVRLCGVKVC